jgi:hypothetical protein
MTTPMRLLGFMMGLTGCLTARALDWASTRIRVETDPFDESTQVTYRFVNSRKVPVHITSAFSSCGCTVPRLSKMDYSPGEQGELVAVFTLGQVIGDQIRSITVTTDEPEGSRIYNLILEARIPRLFEIGPQPVVWQVGERPQARTLTIKSVRPDIHPVKVDSRDPRIQAELSTDVADDRIYRILVTPTTTEQELYAPILVTMNLPERNPRVLILYARIAGSAPPP